MGNIEVVYEHYHFNLYLVNTKALAPNLGLQSCKGSQGTPKGSQKDKKEERFCYTKLLYFFPELIFIFILVKYWVITHLQAFKNY